jgi:outer membrane receptor protein involved in Fe transport
VDGTNVSVLSTRSIDSDAVDNFELGAKFMALGRRLVLNAAVYRMDWEGLPVSQLLSGATNPSCRIIGFSVNAGKARSDGFEVQANFQMTPAFRIDLGGSYIDSRLQEDVPAQGFKAGNRMPGSPRSNANLGLQYDFLLGGHRGFVRMDAIYVGSFYGDLANSPVTKTADYTKVDLVARMTFNKLNVDFFVKNLTDEDAFTFRGAYSFPTGPYYGYQLRPRTIGAQLAYNF